MLSLSPGAAAGGSQKRCLEEPSLEASQDVNPPQRVSPAAKHSAKSRLNVGRDVRHFCRLRTRGDERGGLSLLTPLQGVLRLREELQAQSVRGGCGSWSLLQAPFTTVMAL